MFRRLYLLALAVLFYLVAPKLSLASSLAQAGSPNQLPANSNVVLLVTIALVIALVIGSGVVLTLLVLLITRFFSTNVPPADKMAAFNAQQTAMWEQERARPRKPIKIGPRLEPFVISIGGFLVVFIIASIVIAPAAPANGTNPSGTQTTPAPQSGLPTSGDFTKIVASLPPGNADNGAKLFLQLACSGCHGVLKDQRIVGPSFYGLWGRAGTRKPGYGPKEYIYESIVAPNAYVVDGYPSSIMPQTFAKQLSAQQISDILAFIERDHNEK